MTQFQHTFISTVLTMITAILFKDYLIFPEEYVYWDEYFKEKFF